MMNVLKNASVLVNDTELLHRQRNIFFRSRIIQAAEDDETFVLHADGHRHERRQEALREGNVSLDLTEDLRAVHEGVVRPVSHRVNDDLCAVWKSALHRPPPA